MIDNLLKLQYILKKVAMTHFYVDRHHKYL